MTVMSNMYGGLNYLFFPCYETLKTSLPMGWTREQPKSERTRMYYVVVIMHNRRNQVTDNQEGHIYDLKKSRSFKMLHLLRVL